MLASVIIITAGLQAGKPVLLPIVLSGFLAIVSYPLTTFFKSRLCFPHWLAVTFTVIMDFGILVGLGYLAQYLGQDLAKTVTVKYQPLMMEKIHELRAFLIEQDWNNLADQMLQGISGPAQRPAHRGVFHRGDGAVSFHADLHHPDSDPDDFLPGGSPPLPGEHQ